MIKSLILGGELADIELYGFGAGNTVDLRKELGGESTFLTDAAAKSGGKLALYGIDFRFDDLKRISVVAFHDLFLVDIADCALHFTEADTSELKVYSFRGVKFGLIVDDDVDSSLVWARLGGECDAVIAIVREYDAERRERIDGFRKSLSLPVVVRCGSELYAFGAEEVTIQKN